MTVVLTGEDWLRRKSWDLTVGTPPRIVSTLDELREAIAPMTVQHFMTLPAARAMPAQLKAEVGSAS